MIVIDKCENHHFFINEKDMQDYLRRLIKVLSQRRESLNEMDKMDPFREYKLFVIIIIIATIT